MNQTTACLRELLDAIEHSNIQEAATSASELRIRLGRGEPLPNWSNITSLSTDGAVALLSLIIVGLLETDRVKRLQKRRKK